MATAKNTPVRATAAAASAVALDRKKIDVAAGLEELLLKARVKRGVVYTFIGTGKNGLQEGRRYKVSAVVAAVLVSRGIVKLEGQKDSEEAYFEAKA
jgi:hypothetical protein